MKKRDRISNRILMVLNVVVLLLLVIKLVIQYSNSKNAVHQTFGNDAMTTATNLSGFIEEEKLKHIINNMGEDETYTEVCQQLVTYREITGAFVYTIFEDENGEIWFLVDGMPLGETEGVGELGTNPTILQSVVNEAKENGSANSDIEETVLT